MGVRPTRLKKTVKWGLIVILLLILGLPYGLYFYGLSLVDGYPVPPNGIELSDEVRQKVWEILEDEGTPELEPSGPYTFVFKIIELNFNDKADLHWFKGDIQASWAARQFVSDSNQKLKGMGHWHLTTACFATWISRNWDIDQVLDVNYLYFMRLKEDRDNRLKNAGRTASDSLKIRIVESFVLGDPDKKLEFPVYIPDFGNERGVLLVWEDDPHEKELTRAGVERGYIVHQVPDNIGRLNIKAFLSNLPWFGESSPPDWYGEE